MWVGALATVILVLTFGTTFEAAFAQTPVVDAGPDQTVASGSAVTLDGSGSAPAKTQGVVYSWGRPAEFSQVALSNSLAVQPTFTAPTGPAEITFTLTVIIVSGSSSVSASDTVTITVLAPPRPPIAIRISFCTSIFWAMSSLDHHIFVQTIVPCVSNNICTP